MFNIRRKRLHNAGTDLHGQIAQESERFFISRSMNNSMLNRVNSNIRGRKKEQQLIIF